MLLPLEGESQDPTRGVEGRERTSRVGEGGPVGGAPLPGKAACLYSLTTTQTSDDKMMIIAVARATLGGQK